MMSSSISLARHSKLKFKTILCSWLLLLSFR
jgi:hypothetical protein